MKKIGSLLTVVGLFFSFHTIYHQIQTDTPLLEIIEVMQKANVTIESWKITAKENEPFVSDRSEYDAYVNRIKNQLNNFKWREPTVQDNVIRLTAATQSLKGQVTETVTILTYVKNDVYESKVIYEITGYDWKDEYSNDVFSLFSTRTYGLFSKSPSFYTCVTGKKSDTMRSALSVEANRMMQLLHADFVESLEEPSFVSLSAYNKQWESSIKTNGKKMNLQIALRNEGSNNSTHVLIGTPILLDEY